MKQLLHSSLLILLVAVSLSSCKSKIPKEAKYIPKEAGFVLSLDLKLMEDKLLKGGISIDTLMKRIFKNDSTDTKDKAKFYELKDNAGIDWDSKIFVFALQKTNTDKSISNTFSLMGSLKDPAKLETYLKVTCKH